MAEYIFTVSDASSGLNLAELPMTGASFSRVLNGCGSLSGQLPVWHPSVTENNLGFGSTGRDREITVFRDDLAIWNGPVTNVEGNRNADTVTVTAREATYYFTKRVLEIDKDYDGFDIFDIVRDLDSYMETKQSTGDDGMTLGDNIIAAIPRFAVVATMAGATLTDASPPSFVGAARHTIAEVLDLLATDPTLGFEYRMLYLGSDRTTCIRLLDLAYPSFADSTLLEMTESVLSDFGRSCDWETAATRAHAVGQGYTATRQSSQAVSDGTLLSEVVADVTNTSKTSFIDGYANDLRRLSRPPARTLTAAFTPAVGGIDYDTFELGETVPFQIATPNILSLTADTRHIVQIDTTAGSSEQVERVALTFNLRIDDLGA